MLGLCLALGDRGIGDTTRFECPFEEGFDAAPQSLIAAGKFHQHVPRRGGLERSDRSFDVARDEVEADFGDQLEAAHRFAGRRLRFA